MNIVALIALVLMALVGGFILGMRISLWCLKSDAVSDELKRSPFIRLSRGTTPGQIDG